MNPSLPKMNFPTSHHAKSAAANSQMYKLPPANVTNVRL